MVVVDLLGQLVGGRYRIGMRLGAGGMGEVYEAIDEPLGRRVAVKILTRISRGDDAFRERFRREARVAFSFVHPHMVQVTDFRQPEGEAPFLVMERLVGESLGQRLRRDHALPARTVARVFEQALSALAALHDASSVHRDVKPDNIFLCETHTSEEFVKLLDFGVVKSLAGADPTLTATGAIVGTPAYMAPEQVLGERVGPETDVYAVGAAMYHSLAGVRPFERDDTRELLRAIATQFPPPLADVAPSIDPSLRAIVSTALMRDRGRRFPNARSMLTHVSAWLTGAPLLHEDEPIPTARPRPAFDRPPDTLREGDNETREASPISAPPDAVRRPKS